MLSTFLGAGDRGVDIKNLITLLLWNVHSRAKREKIPKKTKFQIVMRAKKMRRLWDLMEWLWLRIDHLGLGFKEIL